MPIVRRVASEQLRPEEVAVLGELFDAAWRDKSSRFTQEDLEHAFGGIHFLLEEGGRILSHAAVVERELHTGEHRLRTGYAGAVATWPAHQRRGYGTAVMLEVDEHVDRTFQLGALETGFPAFYERLEWVKWRGPMFARTDLGPIRTTLEDGRVLVRLTPSSPRLDLSAPISCEWRSGDVW
ncbi:MAG: GNAT family N-acetyltransferase [Actinomycetota bacterium]